MKACPNGAIVNHDELTVIAGALAAAIELVEMDLRSNRRPNKKFHDDEYRQQMSAWEESLISYRRCLKSVNRMMAQKTKVAA